MAASQWYFPKWQLTKLFFLAAAFGPACFSSGARPLAHPSRSARPPLQPAPPQRA